MLTYWETLIATRSNIAVNDSYAQLWGRKLSNASYTVATYTGILPTTLQTVAGYLESYKIYGNTVQDGTPTPENPIMPSGCGELETTGAHAGQYKLPILSNSTLTNIYLGEVPTTRQIKKLVLNGEEAWRKDSNVGQSARYYIVISDIENNTQNLLSSHFAQSSGYEIGTMNNYRTISVFSVDKTLYPTTDDFKSYLAAQYAAGTPVTVWYVLAEPETGIVNEPLMKIGNYADTIDSTQTSAQIPTAAGETTIGWDGEGLAPSEVELVYKVKG